jgi:hypothetical protein
MRDAGFDVSFRDCPAKGGTGGHPNLPLVLPSNLFPSGSPRGKLQGVRWGSREPHVNFRLIIRALCYRHRKYQIIHQYQNIDTHTSIYRYILPVPTSKCQNENEKKNIACWCEPLVNKLAANPWAFRLKFSTNFSSFPCVPHALPISSYLIIQSSF